MVKSVGRAMEVIDIVSTNKSGVGVTEIASQMDINKSSVYRILNTLEEYGFIEQNKESGKYKLGYKFLEISSRLLDSMDLRTEAAPFLQSLEDYTNEVIHLVVYDQGEVVYLEKLEGSETLRMHSKVGRRAPVHCTSVGKAILAYMEENRVREILEKRGLPKHTDHTITDVDLFMKELKNVKEQGYALDLEENEQGIICIAAPIFDHTERVLASLSISGTSLRMTEERLDDLKERVMEAGRNISKRLGSIQ